MTIAIEERRAATGLAGGADERDDPFEHAMYAMVNAGVRGYPFAHLIVPRVFPAWFYREMVANFPGDDELAPLNERYPLRRTITLSDEDAAAGLAEPRRSFWAGVRAGLSSPAFMDFVVRLFGDAVGDRFAPDLEARLYLFRDAGGYAIGPHADTARKIVTMLFYMPEDERSLACGTTLLKKTGDGPLRDSADNDWSGFAAVKTAPFEANSVAGFLVTDRSYHGVRKTPEGVARRSMQLFILDRSRA